MGYDPRYIVTKAPGVSGPPIPDDEPCLVIRAQDVLAPQMMRIYAALYSSLPYEDMDGGVIEDLDQHFEVLREWRRLNPDKIKVADR